MDAKRAGSAGGTSTPAVEQLKEAANETDPRPAARVAPDSFGVTGGDRRPEVSVGTPIELRKPITRTPIDSLIQRISGGERAAFDELLVLPEREFALGLLRLLYLDDGKVLSKQLRTCTRSRARAVAKKINDDLDDPFTIDALLVRLDADAWRCLLATGEKLENVGGVAAIRAELEEREQLARIEDLLVSKSGGTLGFLDGLHISNDAEGMPALDLLLQNPPARQRALLSRLGSVEVGRLWNRLVDNLPDEGLDRLAGAMARLKDPPLHPEVRLSLAPDNLEQLLAAAERRGVRDGLVEALGGETKVSAQLDKGADIIEGLELVWEAFTETTQVRTDTVEMSPADIEWLENAEAAIANQDARAMYDLLETAGPVRYWALQRQVRRMDLPTVEAEALATDPDEAFLVRWQVTRGDFDRKANRQIYALSQSPLSDWLMQDIADSGFFRKQFDEKRQGGSTYGIPFDRYGARHPALMGTFTPNQLIEQVFLGGREVMGMSYWKAPHARGIQPSEDGEPFRYAGNFDTFDCLISDGKTGRCTIALSTGGYFAVGSEVAAGQSDLPFALVRADLETGRPVFDPAEDAHAALMELAPEALAAMLEQLGSTEIDSRIASMVRRQPWNSEAGASDLVALATAVAESDGCDFSAAFEGLGNESYYELGRALIAMKDPALVRGFRRAVGDEVFLRLVRGTKGERSIVGRALIDGELPTHNATAEFNTLIGDNERPLDPDANRYQYLLLKGFAGDKLGGYMENYRDAMTSWGIDRDRIAFADYNMAVNSLIAAADIARAINETHARTGDDVVLLAHSQGGPHTEALLAQTKREYMAAVSAWNERADVGEEIGPQRAEATWAGIVEARKHVAGNFMSQPAMGAQLAKEIIENQDFAPSVAGIMQISGGDTAALESMATNPVAAPYPGDRVPTVVLVTDSEGKVSLASLSVRYHKNVLGVPSDGFVPSVDQWAVGGATVVVKPTARDHLMGLNFVRHAEHFAEQFEAGTPDDTIRQILLRTVEMINANGKSKPLAALAAALNEVATGETRLPEAVGRQIARLVRASAGPLDAGLRKLRQEYAQDDLSTRDAVPAMLTLLFEEIRRRRS